MSGAEALLAIGIIANIVQLVDFTNKAVERIKDSTEDAQNVPKAFRDIQTTLPLLAITLGKTEEQVKSGGVDEKTCKALRPVLAACSARMNELVEIFDQALPGENASRWKRGWKAISTLGKAKKVGEIARQISELRSSLMHHHSTTLDVRNNQPSNSANRPSMGNINTLEQQKIHQFEFEERCLHSLAFLTMDDRRKGIEPPANKTCKWVSRHPLYQQWNSPGDSGTPHSLLWIKGKPGSGKSTLMKRMVEITEQGPSEAVTSISFFFSASARGDGLERSMEGLYRSLTHQLVWKRRTLLTELALLANEKEVRYGRGNWKWHVKELKEFFHTSIAKAGYGPLKVFVDALDECKDDEVQQVVTAFQRSAAASITNGALLSICWSSRHYPHIRAEKSLVICMEHQNAEDIAAYVSSEVEQFSSIGCELQREIIGKANGVFLWVRLVVPKILDAVDQGYSRGEVEHILQDLPSELDDLFRSILTSLPKRHQRRRATLFQFAIVVDRPMTASEMQCALAFSTVPPPRSIQSWMSSDSYLDPHVAFPNLVREISGGLLENQQPAVNDKDFRIEDRIQFIHLSVRDFLQSPSSHDVFGVTCTNEVFQQGHQTLRNACLAYLSSREVEATMGDRLVNVRRYNRDLDLVLNDFGLTHTGVEADQFRFVKYAAENWPIHARCAEYRGISQADLIQRISEPHFRELLNLWLTSRISLPWISSTIRLDLAIVHAFSTKEMLFFFSCAEDLKSCIRPLLETGVNSFFEIQGRAIAWYAAVMRGGPMPWRQSEVLFELIKTSSASISNYPFANDPVLHELLWCSAPEVIRTLLEHGFSAESRDVKGRTPMQMIVSCSALYSSRFGDVEGKASMIKMLASSGAEVNKRNANGYSPLLLVIRCDPRPKIISTLIEIGSDITASDSHGYTELHLAVKEVLGHKPPENGLCNTYNFDDEYYFRRDRDYRRRYRSNQASAVQAILNAGADPNIQDQQGNTPLHLAIKTFPPYEKAVGHSWRSEEARELVVRTLLNSGTNMALKNNKSVTPIDLIRNLPEVFLPLFSEAVK